MKSRLSRYFFLCARLLLGAIFIAASIDKIAHPAEFAKIVSNYQILPGHLINIVAIVLPWLEAILGLFILCGWCLPGATILANLLLLTFLGALCFRRCAWNRYQLRMLQRQSRSVAAHCMVSRAGLAFSAAWGFRNDPGLSCPLGPAFGSRNT